jgi:23S rRNA-/tRNA-specific pseudouridylate synthase
LFEGGVGRRVTHSFQVSEKYRGERLDRFLQKMVPRMSRAAVQAALSEGRVELHSGLTPKAARRLVPGDRVELRGREAQGPLPDAPVVLHEGIGFRVVDKSAGLRTIPSARHPGSDVATLAGAAPAHRLDRFTSGALILTTTPVAAQHFEALFRTGEIDKEYAAVVVGRPRLHAFRCAAAIGPRPESRVPGMVEAKREDDPAGKDALTEFELVASRETVDGLESLLRVHPHGGRRHQVRVHAAASGHPLVGELLHAGDERDFIRFQLGQEHARVQGLAPGRHLLHARSLAFRDPEGRSCSVVAPWPDDFPPDLIRSWR